MDTGQIPDFAGLGGKFLQGKELCLYDIASWINISYGEFGVKTKADSVTTEAQRATEELKEQKR
jgi:hypothetical protein